MDLARARQHLQAFDLARLFIEDLGWDHPGPDLAVALGDDTLTLRAVAQKRGLGVYLCPALASGLPDHAARRKIHTLVRRQVHEHLLIFTDGARQTLKWLHVRHEPGRPAVSREFDYHAGQSGDALLQRLQGIATRLDEEEGLTIGDMTSRVRATFDVDRATKRFYVGFKDEHDAFLAFLQGLPDGAEARWYASIILNRLMFVYFIQRKGLLAGDADYLRHRLEASQARGPDRFYRELLCPLFFQGFAIPPDQRPAEVRALLGDVPYLNGGIFGRHELETRHGDQIQIADAAFKSLFDFFDAYRWHLDERPLRADNEINPDVLGYIFEKYINQKEMGAYYTKEDITGYIARNTLLPHLLDRARRDCRIAFEGEHSIWRLLQEEPDRYIYPAVRHGCERPLPPEIAAGLHPPTLHQPVGEGPVATLEARRPWNRPAPSEFALPTELWREVVARRARYEELFCKLVDGQVREPNDLITLNLDSAQFLQDVIADCEGPELLRALWRALREVTVLDPTCGSGAFLFAALNLLEPLYEACLDRMATFVGEMEHSGAKHHPDKFSDFRAALREAEQHPSRSYAILKSIIVRNLFGVDLMDEAVEICRLRLFLKLAAQVEGGAIEPLPDIDFNIRAGNALVGFASRGEVEAALTLERAGAAAGGAQAQQGTLMGLLPEVQAEMRAIDEQGEEVERAYLQFQAQQTTHGGEVGPVHKADLRDKLGRLEARLDAALARVYTVDPRGPGYAAWLRTHKPFHWWAAFYKTMRQGGFDVIIGNPPYVEYSKVKGEYLIRGYETESCGNPYALVMERCLGIQMGQGRLGMIVPVSFVSSERMLPVRSKTLSSCSTTWAASFAIRPQPLFPEIMQRNMIVIAQTRRDGARPSASRSFSSRYRRWTAVERNRVFEDIVLIDTSLFSTERATLPKVDDDIARNILVRMESPQFAAASTLAVNASRTLYFHDSGESYWVKALHDKPMAYRNGKQVDPAQSGSGLKSPRSGCQASTF